MREGRRPPDVPKMDGIAALRHMRQMHAPAALPIVMLTTQVDTETVRTALGYRATDFIRKDASIPRITERLPRYLQEGKKPEPEAQAQPFDPRIVEEIVKKFRRYHPQENGPYILCYESPQDLQALGEAKDRGLVDFYRRVMEVVDIFQIERDSTGTELVAVIAGGF